MANPLNRGFLILKSFILCINDDKYDGQHMSAIKFQKKKTPI